MTLLQRSLAADLLGAEFLSGLTRDLGIADASTESKEEVLAALGENIAERLTYEILARLKDEEREHTEKLLETSDTPALMQYLQVRIPDFENFLRTTAQDELLETLSEIRGKSQ